MRPSNIERGDGQVNQIELVVNEYLEWLRAHGYAESTVRARRYYLAGLVGFLLQREIADPRKVTPHLIDAYQHHLFSHRKVDGRPLSFCTQAQRLVPVKGLFDWLSRTGAVASNPAASITLPKTEDRLPSSVLSVDEVEAVLAQPNASTALGVRDRAILEVLYSTAIRRSELTKLFVADVDHARASLFIRQGKGGRDRFVPIGERALSWVRRYLEEVRPNLDIQPNQTALFLSVTGDSIAPDVLTRMVRVYMRAGAPAKAGSCHLFRHTAATLMLDAGADIRHIAEMLGHRRLETTMAYTRVSMTKLHEVHAKYHPAEQSLRAKQF
jgi:integrase/recombinase XerD